MPLEKVWCTHDGSTLWRHPDAIIRKHAPVWVPGNGSPIGLYAVVIHEMGLVISRFYNHFIKDIQVTMNSREE